MVVDKKVLRERVSYRVEENKDDLVRILQELVRTPSVNPLGNYNKISHLMVEYYKAEGLNPVIACASEEEVKKNRAYLSSA